MFFFCCVALSSRQKTPLLWWFTLKGCLRERECLWRQLTGRGSLIFSPNSLYFVRQSLLPVCLFVKISTPESCLGVCWWPPRCGTILPSGMWIFAPFCPTSKLKTCKPIFFFPFPFLDEFPSVSHHPLLFSRFRGSGMLWRGFTWLQCSSMSAWNQACLPRNTLIFASLLARATPSSTCSPSARLMRTSLKYSFIVVIIFVCRLRLTCLSGHF